MRLIALFSSQRPMRAILWLCVAGLLQACATQPPPRETAPVDAVTQQRELMRSYFNAMLQRDELYEASLGVRRTEPIFPALKKSMAAVYSDPVIVDWMLDQLGTDRGGFGKRFALVASEGFARVDDAAAWKMVRPLGTSMGRLNSEQCRTWQSESKEGGAASNPFARWSRNMTPDEMGEFMDGLRLALRAGIQRQPLRSIPTPAQVTAALRDLPPPGTGECESIRLSVAAIDAAQGERRSHLLTMMMVMAGIGARSAK